MNWPAISGLFFFARKKLDIYHCIRTHFRLSVFQLRVWLKLLVPWLTLRNVFINTTLSENGVGRQSALRHILHNWSTVVWIITWAACGRTILVGQSFGRARQTSKVPTTTHFRWKIKWRPELLGALWTMGETWTNGHRGYSRQDSCLLEYLFTLRRAFEMFINSKEGTKTTLTKLKLTTCGVL